MGLFIAMNQSFFLEALDRPIAFHRLFAKAAGSVNAGVMLSQAFYWSKRTKNPAGWFYKTQAEWEEETCLTRREQETARKSMREAGFWEEKLEGIPAKLHFRLNLSALEARAIFVSQISQTSMAESAILDCTEAPNLEGGIRQAIICTESTSEITLPELKNSGHERLEIPLFPEMARRDEVPTPARKRGRPPKAADPRYTPFLKIWLDLYAERFARNYNMGQMGRDGKHLNSLLAGDKSLTAERFSEVINSIWGLEVQKGDFAPNAIKIHDLTALCTRWNQIVGNIS